MRTRVAHIQYTKAELAWIESHASLTRRDAHAKFCKKFGRADVSFDNYKNLCKRNGWLTGRDGRLQPGNVPANKGKKMPYNPNSAKTQFKKGQRPHNTRQAGAERMHEDGYVYISVDETNPHTGFERRYVLKHKYLWEQKNGKLPDGMVLKCLDGNRTNCDPANWEPIARGALALLNGRWALGYDQVADELKPVILTTAKLKHKLKERKKNAEKS